MRRSVGLLRCLAVLGLGLGSGACHHGSSSPAVASTTANPTGVWKGTDSVSNLTLVGFINTAGQADFIRADGVQFTGILAASASTLSGTLDGYSRFNGTFADGSTYGVGALGGSVSTSQSIGATWTFTTADNTTTENEWSLTYVAADNIASALSAVAGNYTDSEPNDASNGATVTISGSGALSAQNPTNSCVLSGQVTANDPTIDVYQVSVKYASCTGVDAALNGIDFSGLAAVDASVKPAQVLIGVVGESSSGNSYGLVMVLNAT